MELRAPNQVISQREAPTGVLSQENWPPLRLESAVIAWKSRQQDETRNQAHTGPKRASLLEAAEPWDYAARLKLQRAAIEGGPAARKPREALKQEILMLTRLLARVGGRVGSVRGLMPCLLLRRRVQETEIRLALITRCPADGPGPFRWSGPNRASCLPSKTERP